MKLPYKYPYLSIFILGYYFLEHEGYYYKIRDYFGYSSSDDVSYVVKLTSSNLDPITKAPGRKSLILVNKTSDSSQELEFRKIAKKYKEKLRSPVLFGKVTCEENLKFCSASDLTLLLLNEGEVVKQVSEPVSKKLVKKILK